MEVGHSLPVTPLHYPFAFGISKVNKKLNLSGLVVGTVFPDIEVPILVIFFQNILPDHLVLHSLIGAFTVGLFLAIFVTKYIYPPLIGRLFGLNLERLRAECDITPTLTMSVALGIVSHLAVDLLYHPFNPILWPWVNPYSIIGPLDIYFSTFLGGDILTGFLVANVAINIIMGSALALIIIRTNESRWERIWIG